MVSEIGKVIRRAWGRPALVLALLLILLPQGAWATSATWLGTTTNYNLTTNWEETPPTVPGDGETDETASFTDTGAGAVNIGTATANAVGFSFSNADYDYTITLADGVTQGLTGVTTTDSGNVTLAASGTGTYTLPSVVEPFAFTIGAGQTTTISGALSGTGCFEKGGDGTLILTGNNTYTGGTYLLDGTLAVGNDSALGPGGLTSNGGRLEASGGAHTLGNPISVVGYYETYFTLGGTNDLTLSGAIALGDNFLTNTNSANTTLTDVISGADCIIVQNSTGGTGILTLSGSNTYSGQTGLGGGTLLVGNNHALGTSILNLAGGTLGASAADIQLANNINLFRDSSIGGAAGTSLTLTGNLYGEEIYPSITLSHTGASSDTLSGQISESIPVAIAVASGTLTLSGNNTYSGGTTLNGGTLSIGSNTALGFADLSINGGTFGASAPGIAPTNTITVNGSFNMGTTAGNDLTLAQNLALGGNTITHTGIGTSAIAGGVSGTGSIAVVSGALTLSGDNTYTGGTTLTGGTLKAGDANALGTGLVTVNGGMLDITTAGLNATALAGTGGTVDLGGQTLALGNDETARTYAGLITGTGGLTYDNTSGGSLTLSGANTYSGGTYLRGGTLAVGNDSALGTGWLTIHGATLEASGGDRTLDNFVTVLGDFSIGGATDFNLSGDVILENILTVENTATTTLESSLSGTGEIIKPGAGTLILAGDNSYDGGTTLTAGTLVAAADAALGTGGLTMNGGNLQAGGVGARTLTNAVTLNANSSINGVATNDLTLTNTIDLGTRLLTVNGAGNVTLSNVISGAGGTLTKGGTSILTLSGVNTYGGGTTLTAGFLGVGSNTALGSGDLTINGGTLEASGGARTLANNVTVGGDFALAGADNLTLSGSIDLGDHTLTNINSAKTTLTDVISGANGSIVQDSTGGSGTLILNGANTYGGGTTLDAGTLAATNNAALGTGGLALNGGTLLNSSGGGVTLSNSITMGGAAKIGGTFGYDLTLSGAIDLGGNTLTNTNSANTTLTGDIGGTGGIVQDGTYGTSTLTLTGNNTYSGGTFLNGGTLAANNNEALGGGGLDLNGGTLLNSSGGGVTLSNSITMGGAAKIGGTFGNDLTLSGDIALGDHTLINSNSANTTLTGVISGAGGSIVQKGTGTLTLSGANTYSGGTSFAGGGTLAVGNDFALGLSDLVIYGGTLEASGGSRTLVNNVHAITDFTLGGTNDLTLSGDIALGGTITNSNSANTTLTGVISGLGGIVQDSAGGTGTLTLTGNNTYFVGTTLNRGTLLIGSSQALGGGGLTINGGTLLNSSGGGITLSNSITVGGAATIGGTAGNDLTLSSAIALGANTLTNTNSANTTLTGVISGTGGIVQDSTGGTGTLTLSGGNYRYDGLTTLNGGILAVGHDFALGNGGLTINGGTMEAAASTILFNAITAGGDFTLGGDDYLMLCGAIALGDHRLTNTNTANTYLTDVISGVNGSIVQDSTGGSGRLILNGANTYGGGTTLNGGTLLAGNNTALGSGDLIINGANTGLGASAAGVSLANNITANNSFGIITAYALTLSGSIALGDNTLTNSNWNNTTLAGVISGAGGRIVQDSTDGNGILTLSGVNTYGGGTTLTAGFLGVGSNTALGSGDLTINGGTLEASGGARTLANNVTVDGDFNLGGTDDLTLSGAIALGDHRLTNSNSANTTLTGVISGANGSIVQDSTGGTGTLILNGANTYGGGTTLKGGTLAVNNDAALGTGRLAWNGGTLLNSSGGAVALNNIIYVGPFATATIGGTAGNDLTLSGYVALFSYSTLTVSSAANTTITRDIHNPGALMQSGTGTLTLPGPNAYSGGTTLNSGTLLAGDNNALGTGALNINGGTLAASAAGIVITNELSAVGGDFNLGGASDTSLTLTKDLNLGAHTLTHNGASSDTLAGGVSGSGAIIVNTGTLNLSGANSYAGGTTLNGGTLAANNNAALGGGGLALNGGTLLNNSGGGVTLSNSITVGGATTLGGTAGNDLTLSGNVDLGTNTLTVTNAADTTISGIISGATGSIVQNSTGGGGTLTLSGANTYGGGTTLNDGTLLAGNNNAFGTGNLTINGGVLRNASGGLRTWGNDIMANANFTLNAVNDIVLTGIISGLGGFDKTGGGVLTLSGANTYTGVTTVTSGTLNLSATGSITSNLNNWDTTIVNGNLFGNVTNNVDAILRGAGTITGNLNNSGTVSPGNSVGTLNVVGSFTQTAGGVLEVEIESAASYDKVAVTGAPGTATVAGTLKPTLLGGYSPAPNTLLPGIITATGGVTSTFNTIDSELACKLLYYADRIDLLMNLLAPPVPINPRVAFNYDDPSFPLTGNQRNIGLMFNAVKESASGDLGSVLDIIRQLPGGAAVANAYQQISPDKGSAMPAVSLAGSMMQWRTLTNRLNYLRWSGGEGGVGPTYSIGGSGKLALSYSSLSGLMLAYNGANLSSLISGKRPAPTTGNRWGVYTDFVGTMGNLNSSVNQTGYDYNIFGFNSGVDYRLRDNLIIGVGSGYYHTATSFSGSGGSVEVNSIPFYAYGLYYPSSFYAMGSVGYTLNLYGLNRNLRFGDLNRVAESSVTGSQFNISGETGYDFTLRGLILTPAASLYYSKAWVGSYTEKGANALNLKVDAQSADSLQTGVGVRVARPFKVKNTQVVPQASAFYQHEFANNSRGLDARLPQTGTNFSYTTVSPRRDFAVLGAGVAVGLKKNLFVQANYNAEVGRGNSTTHFVSAGLRWEF